MPAISLVIALALALSAIMAGAWAIARHPGNSGWIDAIWSLGIGAAGVAAALLGGGVPARQGLVAALVAAWSLRLALHIARRTIGNGDDPRYVELRREWGDNFERRLFGFLQIQAAAALLLVVSILLAARNPSPTLGWSDWLGVIIMAVAILGEAAADSQLAAFRANPANQRRVCDIGLWAVSRHPNYVSEWFGWLAYPVIAIGPDAANPWSWLALSGPVLMYVLLVHISGIPPLEAHMLRSRGSAFANYQARVPAFWPFFKTERPS